MLAGGSRRRRRSPPMLPETLRRQPPSRPPSGRNVWSDFFSLELLNRAHDGPADRCPVPLRYTIHLAAPVSDNPRDNYSSVELSGTVDAHQSFQNPKMLHRGSDNHLSYPVSLNSSARDAHELALERPEDRGNAAAITARPEEVIGRRTRRDSRERPAFMWQDRVTDRTQHPPRGPGPHSSSLDDGLSLSGARSSPHRSCRGAPFSNQPGGPEMGFRLGKHLAPRRRLHQASAAACFPLRRLLDRQPASVGDGATQSAPFFLVSSDRGFIPTGCRSRSERAQRSTQTTAARRAA